MKVLVTGGSGFVGQRLLQGLSAAGISVRATYRRAQPPMAASVRWCPLPDLSDGPALDQAVAGIDAIIHLVGLAHQPADATRLREFLRVNRDGTRHLAAAAGRAGVRRLIFASSIAAVCTRSDAPIDDRTACAPTDAYGYSKLEAEHALAEALASGSTDWCILRPPLLYGPGNPGNMRRLLRLIETGLPLPFGAIHNRRSFMFVDNLVDAMLTVLRHPDAIRSAFALCDGSDFSTPELVSALAAALGRKAHVFPMPIAVLKLIGYAGDALDALFRRHSGLTSAALDRLIGSLLVDGRRFGESFGWRPPVSPQAALQRTGQAYRSGELT